MAPGTIESRRCRMRVCPCVVINYRVPESVYIRISSHIFLFTLCALDKSEKEVSLSVFLFSFFLSFSAARFISSFIHPEAKQNKQRNVCLPGDKRGMERSRSHTGVLH